MNNYGFGAMMIKKTKKLAQGPVLPKTSEKMAAKTRPTASANIRSHTNITIPP